MSKTLRCNYKVIFKHDGLALLQDLGLHNASNRAPLTRAT